MCKHDLLHGYSQFLECSCCYTYNVKSTTFLITFTASSKHLKIVGVKKTKMFHCQVQNSPGQLKSDYCNCQIDKLFVKIMQPKFFLAKVTRYLLHKQNCCRDNSTHMCVYCSFNNYDSFSIKIDNITVMMKKTLKRLNEIKKYFQVQEQSKLQSITNC